MDYRYREAQSRLMRGLLDLTVLKILNVKPMCGYEIMNKIKKDFDVCFGPSTIYPFLGVMEEKGYVKSHWDLGGQRPKKIYVLAPQGKKLLKQIEPFFELVRRGLRKYGKIEPKPTEMITPLGTERKKRPYIIEL